MKAATYARYSSDKQRESSITDQQRNMHQRASAEGWSIVADFADAALSGTSSDRPQYQAMVRAAERHEFDVLLLDDLSRLSRDALESERVIRKLEFAGVRIVACADGYDSQSRSRKLHRGFKSLMNETFIDDLSERVHRGQKGQALQGRWNGGRPYGYKLKRLLDESRRDQYGEALRIGTELVVDPVQASVVREIFQQFGEGQSMLRIAAELNRRNVASPGSTWNRKTRRCEKWVNTAVRSILINPLYTGRMRWNRRQFVRDPESGKHVARLRPTSDYVITNIPALRIVTEEVFDLVAAKLKANQDPDNRLKRGGKLRHALSGLLKCDACGRSFVIADARSYACSSFLHGGTHACSNHVRVRRDVLEAAIRNEVNSALDPKRIEKHVRDAIASIRQRENGVTSAGELTDQMKALDDRISRLRRRLRDGDPDLDADELQAAIGAAEAKRARLAVPRPKGTSVAFLATLPKASERLRAQIKKGFDTDDVASAARAREILRRVLGTIRLRVDEEGLWAESQISVVEPLKILATDESHISMVGVKGFVSYMRVLVKPARA